MLQHQLVVQQILAKENSQITQVRNTFLNLMAISWAESSAPAWALCLETSNATTMLLAGSPSLLSAALVPGSRLAAGEAAPCLLAVCTHAWTRAHTSACKISVLLFLWKTKHFFNLFTLGGRWVQTKARRQTWLRLSFLFRGKLPFHTTHNKEHAAVQVVKNNISLKTNPKDAWKILQQKRHCHPRQILQKSFIFSQQSMLFRRNDLPKSPTGSNGIPVKPCGVIGGPERFYRVLGGGAERSHPLWTLSWFIFGQTQLHLHVLKRVI